MKPWMFILIGVFLITAAFWYGKEVGKDLKENEVLKVQQEAASKARADEQRKQAAINIGLQEQINEKNTINDKLLDDINRLQHRESRRLSETTGIRCKGTTGAELSKQDAEFLTREAARADTLRAALKACYHYADSINKE